MLAADAELELASRRPAALGGKPDQFADAVAVERHERIGRDDALRLVDAEKARRVVAADAVGGLRQIVGAEREELGRLRDLAGHERGARQFDHGADLIFDLGPGLLADRRRHGVDARLDDVELGLGGDERHHDLRHHGRAGRAAGFDRGLEDGARLHLGDLRIGDGEPTAAEAEHRVELVQFAGAVGEQFRIGAHRRCDLGDFRLGVRQELVQRRVEQPDRHRQAAHDLEQLDEIAALHRQELGERGAARGLVLRQNHFAHGADAVFLEEHVLGAAQPDAFGAELDRGARVGRRIGVGAHFQLAHAVGPFHQRGELAGQFRLAHRHLADAAPARSSRRW